MILNPDPEDLITTENKPESIDDSNKPAPDAVADGKSENEAEEPLNLPPDNDGETATADQTLEEAVGETNTLQDESDVAPDRDSEASKAAEGESSQSDETEPDAEDEADVTFDGNRPIVQELQYKESKTKAATEEDEPADELRFSTVAEAKAVVEGFLFSSNEPLSVARLSKLMGDLHPKTVRGLLLELQWDYENRPGALQVVEIAGGYLMSTRPYVAPWMFRLHKLKRRSPLSPATLEALAIIAYRQPITKGEIEGVRGVETGAPLRTLQELNLIEARGRREVVGRPQLYVTTDHFLKVFALNSLAELPSISELKSRFAEEQRLKTPVKKAMDETAKEPTAEETADGPEATETTALSEGNADSADVISDDLDPAESGEADQEMDLDDDALESDDAQGIHDEKNALDEENASDEGLDSEADSDPDLDDAQG